MPFFSTQASSSYSQHNCRRRRKVNSLHLRFIWTIFHGLFRPHVGPYRSLAGPCRSPLLLAGPCRSIVFCFLVSLPRMMTWVLAWRYSPSKFPSCGLCRKCPQWFTHFFLSTYLAFKHGNHVKHAWYLCKTYF